jgi:Zn-dependent M32 family carboxypeptidase
MRAHIHRHGSNLLPQDLMEEATGSKTDPTAYLDHLRDRFIIGAPAPKDDTGDSVGQ